MKKIGIITFHSSYNCGSMLQAFALQNVIKNKYELDSEFINFVNRGSLNKYSFYIKNNSLKNIVKNILYFYNFKIKNRQYFGYDKFSIKFLKVSEKKYSHISEMSDVENQYDIFISGSDQIWNITCDDADIAYFLPFIKEKRKIAYAPSLGAKNISKYAKNKNEYRKYLDGYYMLSCREKNGQKWINELTDKKVDLICDPTLLLTMNDYEKLELKKDYEYDYIFYYSYGYVENENRIVNELANRLNMNVIIFNGKRWCTLHKKYRRFILPVEESPSSFLNVIKNAKLVLTSSFHGTVFATIYRKKFWVMKNDGMLNGDDRVDTLLEQLGLTNRYIMSTDDLDNNKILTEIDYANVEKKIKYMQEKAFSYLNEALNEK